MLNADLHITYQLKDLSYPYQGDDGSSLNRIPQHAVSL